jgi:predicted N-acyltransferase
MEVHLESRFSDLPLLIREALTCPAINPFFTTAFLQNLETAGCVGAQSGWQPRHLWIEVAGQPLFFMPLYSKTHSWGEFVFDQSWASAYHRYGLRYYPKLVTAIPFTPSIGPRWWVAEGGDEPALLQVACQYIAEQLNDGMASSWHALFAEKPFPGSVTDALLSRKDVQFHWCNRDYSSFDDFLNQMKSRKRKSIRRERQKVAEQGVTLERRLGTELQEKDWADFYGCYCNTYHERGASPYLSLAFFRQIGKALASHIMMVQAFRDEHLIGAAICFFDDKTLYGRHWGALQQVDCLHFEACFYQGIEFCIERGLLRFDPGTQGEHKLLRGFEPVQTTSWHLIGHSAFRDAIADHLSAEEHQTERYQQSAAEYLPFKNQ